MKKFMNMETSIVMERNNKPFLTWDKEAIDENLELFDKTKGINLNWHLATELMCRFDEKHTNPIKVKYSSGVEYDIQVIYKKITGAEWREEDDQNCFYLMWAMLDAHMDMETFRNKYVYCSADRKTVCELYISANGAAEPADETELYGCDKEVLARLYEEELKSPYGKEKFLILVRDKTVYSCDTAIKQDIRALPGPFLRRLIALKKKEKAAIDTAKKLVNSYDSDRPFSVENAFHSAFTYATYLQGEKADGYTIEDFFPPYRENPEEWEREFKEAKKNATIVWCM